eukprot:2179053-Pyramimonas_sp.AAC.2
MSPCERLRSRQAPYRLLALKFPRVLRVLQDTQNRQVHIYGSAAASIVRRTSPESTPQYLRASMFAKKLYGAVSHFRGM